MTRATFVTFVAAWSALVGPSSGQARFPARLDEYFTNVLKLTDKERAALQSGAPLVRALEADASKEVAVVGAIWIAVPITAYISALNDIENFEKGPGFLATKKISDPARLEDFAPLSLPDDDVRDLRSCTVGDCALKLSEDALNQVRREIDWSKPTATADVEALMRRLAVAYVTEYRKGGNSALAVYRDNKRPTFVAEELRGLIDSMPAVSQYLPDMRRYLLEYPKTPAPSTSSFFYWQEANFGLKPTIRINHVAIQQGPESTVVASKQLYSSHYFWTALELRVLVPDPARGAGFWFVNVNRSRSDGLSGFVGRIIRGKVQSGARDGLVSALNATKKRLEGR